MVFLIISINFFGFCDAPPIKKPSMLGILFNLSALLELTDPPYKIFTEFLNFFVKILEFYGGGVVFANTGICLDLTI